MKSLNEWITTWKEFLTTIPELIPPEHKTYSFYSGTSYLKSETLAKEEDFWKSVRLSYPQSAEVINFNSGAVSSSPYVVEQAYLYYYQLVNRAPSYFIFKVMDRGISTVKEGLSCLLNCNSREIALLRNTTEAANNVIFGLDLKETDEVVVCLQDYAKIVSSWRQREKRDGVKVRWINLHVPDESDEDIIQKYVDSITSNTRLVHLTHVINWNGQVLPVAKIIQQIRQKNPHVKIFLDGAHSFALLETNLSELQVDFFVAPLHKWLSAPITGAVLFIRKKEIPTIWPLASASNPRSGEISKFEELSMVLIANFLAAGFALEYYFHLRREVKEQRLRYIRRLWRSQLKDVSWIQSITPKEEHRQCVITTIRIGSYSPQSLEQRLLHECKIHVGLVNWENISGIRITPNVYTTPEEIEQLVAALRKIAE